MLYIKHINSKEIYPFTQELWDTGCFVAYESSLCEDDEIIDALSEDEELYNEIKSFPKSILTKDIVEQLLDKRISNKVFDKAMKRFK